MGSPNNRKNITSYVKYPLNYSGGAASLCGLEDPTIAFCLYLLKAKASHGGPVAADNMSKRSQATESIYTSMTRRIRWS